jgi:hypothetical protein
MNYITGDGFKNKCRWVLDGSGFIDLDVLRDSRPKTYMDDIIGNLFFCKTDYLPDFEKTMNGLPGPVVLITHNSDINITEKYKAICECGNVIQWLAQNVDYEHYKLHSIPIGLSNAGYPNGDTQYFDKVIAMNLPKTKMLHASYSVCTNRDRRNACINGTGIVPSRCGDFKEYLPQLAQSRFVIAPEGNGIDTVRIWESLYVKTIPIVLDCQNIRFYRDQLPMVVLNSWGQFNRLELSEDMYKKIWDDFDPSILTVDFYLWKYLCKNM